jgi:hypothetical protein
MSVAVEKLPTWCFGGDYALMGHTRELSQQLLNGPFNEVKARMVRFFTMDERPHDRFLCRQKVQLHTH